MYSLFFNTSLDFLIGFNILQVFFSQRSTGRLWGLYQNINNNKHDFIALTRMATLMMLTRVTMIIMINDEVIVPVI